MSPWRSYAKIVDNKFAELFVSGRLFDTLNVKVYGDMGTSRACPYSEPILNASEERKEHPSKHNAPHQLF